MKPLAFCSISALDRPLGYEIVNLGRGQPVLLRNFVELMEHIAGKTFHGRRGALVNRFTYGVDYVALDPEAPVTGPAIFRRNRVTRTSMLRSNGWCS